MTTWANNVEQLFRRGGATISIHTEPQQSFFRAHWKITQQSKPGDACPTAPLFGSRLICGQEDFEYLLADLTAMAEAVYKPEHARFTLRPEAIASQR